MLDIAYETLKAFITDCLYCGYDAYALLVTGEYRYTLEGFVVSRHYAAP